MKRLDVKSRRLCYKGDQSCKLNESICKHTPIWSMLTMTVVAKLKDEQSCALE